MSDANSNHELVFDSPLPKEKSVKIGNDRYTLVEGSAATINNYRESISRSTELGPDGKVVRIVGLAPATTRLVAACLFRETAEGRMAVPLVEVEKLPDRIVRRLHEECEKLSGLGEYREKTEQVEANAKN